MVEKMKILAVDDDMVNLATIEQELRDKYDVIPMNTGRRALKYLFKETVDLVLLDVEMPIMDGIETLKEIRARENLVTLPVIFLTSKNDKHTVIEGSKLGIMDYIIKPFNSDNLHDRIERALKRHGTLPMEGEELYKRIKDIGEYLSGGKLKVSLDTMEEILGYQIDEEVSGRMKIAKTKLKEGDLEGALRMIERILKLLEKNEVVQPRLNALPITLGEMNSRLLYILDDLEKFNTTDAKQKMEDLLWYELPPKVYEACIKAKTKLEEFDDDEAERVIRGILKEI